MRKGLNGSQNNSGGQQQMSSGSQQKETDFVPDIYHSEQNNRGQYGLLFRKMNRVQEFLRKPMNFLNRGYMVVNSEDPWALDFDRIIIV